VGFSQIVNVIFQNHTCRFKLKAKTCNLSRVYKTATKQTIDDISTFNRFRTSLLI